MLEDARYDPPPSQLNLVENPATRERLQENLKAPTGTLRYRWARTAVLMVSLRQMGAGAPHPLARAAFAPFADDFKDILASYRALRQDVEAVLSNPSGGDAEENLLASVDSLLRRIYAYISWGLLQQADHEGDIDQTLEELGFRIPKTRGRRLADIVVPAVLPVALITMLFWVLRDVISVAMGWESIEPHDIVWSALTSTITAAVMYGSAVFIALKGRATQIEEKAWRDGSAKCLIPIALKAGLVTWGVIVAATLISYQFPQIWHSLIAMVQGLKSFVGGTPADAATEGWLPIKIVTALPWMLVGGTVSAVLAILLGGDARRVGRSQRIREAMILGVAVALAASVAQDIQYALKVKLEGGTVEVSEFFPLLALPAFACGAFVGFKVPSDCRNNLVNPIDPIAARALRNLLAQANAALGSDVAAADWVFAPYGELEGITPAEAVQYKTQATGVRRLLEAEAVHRREEARSERLMPKVIEGGRTTSELSSAIG